MAFDLKIWKAKCAAGLRGWTGRMKRAGVSSAYAFVSAAALWPVVEAYKAGELPALVALGGVLGGVGGNLVANRIQTWKDESGAARDLAAVVGRDAALRSELDLVLEGLGAFAMARDAAAKAERDEAVGQIRAELERLGNLQKFQVQLDGGSHQTAGERSVQSGEISHSTVITGDKNRVVLARKYVEKQVIRGKGKRGGKDAGAEAERAYLRALRRACSDLPLATLGYDDGDAPTLDEVYVSLDTETRIGEETGGLLAGSGGKSPLGGREARAPLSCMDAALQCQRLVLLGHPGSGKSTFVRQLAGKLAAVRLGELEPIKGWERKPLPVLMTVQDLVARVDTSTLDALSGQKRREAVGGQVRDALLAAPSGLGEAAFRATLERALKAEGGDVLLVLDGLDEVPEAARAVVREALSVLPRACPGVQRVIVTCRVRSYPEGGALKGFVTHRVAPFDDQKIGRFVDAWYDTRASRSRLSAERLQERKTDLLAAVRSDSLKEMASNPLLLTTMAILHQREIGLPRQRVCLYREAVQILVRRWQKEKGVAVSSRLETLLGDEQRLLEVLERIAYVAHAAEAEAGAGSWAEMTRGALLDLLDRPENLGDAGVAADFLDYVDRRAGILIDHGGTRKATVRRRTASRTARSRNTWPAATCWRSAASNTSSANVWRWRTSGGSRPIWLPRS